MNASRTFAGGPALPAQHAACLAWHRFKRKPNPRRQRTRKPSSSSSAPATLLSCTRPSSEPLNRRVASRGWKLTWRGALDWARQGSHAMSYLLEHIPWRHVHVLQSARLVACRHSFITTQVK